MQTLGIGEIARQAGVASSTIRYYERIGLLPPSKRVSGKRRYDAAILEKLGVIRLAQNAGYSIAEIHTLLHEFPAETTPSERWQTLAVQKIVELEKRMQDLIVIKSLLEHTLECACPSLDDCGHVIIEA
jgi:MerR family transcriptional regulator, redox-sensitive transcriptional activator SoxR